MAEKNTFHLSAQAAETYEFQRVPAIFGPMAEATLDAIEILDCREILDVACGTGAMARAVATRLSSPSHIVGCDLNEAMIDVARRNSPASEHSFEWIVASALAMPFNDDAFELVLCQHGLQFFPDKPAALKEIHRVSKPGARLVVTCWKAIPPFFQIVAKCLRRNLNEATAIEAVKPFVWNNTKEILSLIEDAGFECDSPKTLNVSRRLAADPQTMRAELLSTPNEGALLASGDENIARIVAEIMQDVEQFREGETLVMPQQAHLFEAVAL